MSAFGRIITGADIEAAVRDTLKRWTPDYLAEVAEQNGRDRGVLAPFRSYMPALDMDALDTEQIPACIIVAPGTLDRPTRHGNTWRVRWEVNVAAVVSGQNYENTFVLGQLYGAAVRAVLLQNQSLGEEWSDGVTWTGERYDDLGAASDRTLVAASVSFGVDVPAAVDSRGGIAAPTAAPAEPVPGWGTVQTVTTTTEYRSE